MRHAPARSGTVTLVCGRYASTRSAVALAAFFDAEDDTGDQLAPAEELRPTDPVPIVRPSGTYRALGVARWGLLSPWRPDAGPVLFNARAETLATKPAFRESFARYRCLVPADGWYEWRRAATLPAPQKCYLSGTGTGPLAFAGLYRPPFSGYPASCTIVTTAALGALTAVHDRMPLVLDAARWPEWLDCAAGPAAGPDAGLLAPPAAGTVAALQVNPVGPAPAYETPTLF